MTTLVLLPGMDGTGELFAPFIAALGPGARVQVLRHPPQLTRYADLTHLVQKQLPRHEPFVLLGESFSGPVAVAVAASRPTNLIGLVLCCSFVRCPLPFVSRLGPALGLLPLHRAPRWSVNGLLLGRFATPLPSASVVTLPSPHMLLQAAPSEAAAVVTSFMHAAVASSRAARHEHPAAS